MKKSKILKLVFAVSIFSLCFVTGCSSRLNSSNIKKGKEMNNPVIAHRGAWKLLSLPQNSIASLQQAIKLKCRGSEFDVHLTADDILVVNHDHLFYGIAIEKSTYQELQSKKHSNGESIPTAEEYLKAGLKQNYTKLIFELKPSQISKERTLKATELSANLVKKLDKKNLVGFISFDYDALECIKDILPKAEVAYLNGDINPQQVEKDGLTGINYNMSIYKKKPNWIKEAQQANLSVNVWTVNSKADMQYFIGEGVDYITTDFPELLFDALKENDPVSALEKL